MNPLLWLTPFGPMLFFMGLLSSGSEGKKTTDMQGRLVGHWLLLARDMPKRITATLSSTM